MDAWALGSGVKPFWKTRAYDFNVTSEKTLHAKLDYIHKNPITRGLVQRAEQWVGSSYRYYEYDDDSVIAMDWDGSWPIVWLIRPPPFGSTRRMGHPRGLVIRRPEQRHDQQALPARRDGMRIRTQPPAMSFHLLAIRSHLFDFGLTS